MTIQSIPLFFVALAGTKRIASKTIKSVSRSSSYPSILCGDSRIPPFELFPLIKAGGRPNIEFLLSPAYFPVSHRVDFIKHQKNTVFVCKKLDCGFAF